MAGIEATKRVIGDLQTIAVSGIDIFKNGKGMALFTSIAAIVSGAGDVVAQALLVWPELKDLDEAESTELGKLSFQLITAIIKKVQEAGFVPAVKKP